MMIQLRQPSTEDFFAQGKVTDGFQIDSYDSSSDEYSDCEDIEETDTDGLPLICNSSNGCRGAPPVNVPSSSMNYLDSIIGALQDSEETDIIPEGSIESLYGPKIRDLRFCLGDWIFNLSFAYPLTTEVLYQTFSLADRYLSRKAIDSSQFQLLAACCMWVCAKVELTATQSLDPLVQCCHGKYTREDFLNFEKQDLLPTVDWNTFSSTGRNFFLRRFLNLMQAGPRVEFIASYLSEISLLFIEFSSMKPSLVAFTCVVIAWILEKKGNLRNLKSQIRYTYEEVRHCAGMLLHAVKNVSSRKLAVTRKFNLKKVDGEQGQEILQKKQFGSGLLLSIASLFGRV